MAVQTITGAATSVAAFIGRIGVESPRKVRSWSEFGKAVEGSASAATLSYLGDAVYGWFENGGGPCWIAGVGEGGSVSEYEAALAGLDAEVTIVVTPDLWESQGEGAVIAKAVARHCVDARNRMALLHTAQDAEPAKVPALLGLDDEEAQFTTVYYPWLKVADGNGGEKAAPPTGHVAGIWARTDAERGVHKAPANAGVRGVSGLQRTLTDAEQAEINEAGVNCLRAFPG
ncbi:phage tail sheath subtilisin-like domain-containing protein [Streptomyces sp. NPDC054797]